MTAGDNNNSSQRPSPTLEDLKEQFSEEISALAKGAAREVPGISPELADRVKAQVQAAVDKEATSLSEAIFPFLERFAESRLSALSQSILQSTIQAVVIPEAPPPITRTVLTEVTVLTSSVTSSLEETFQEGTTTSSGVVLWRWNKTDISQFDSTILTGGNYQVTMSYRAEDDMALEAGILFSLTSSNPGGAAAVRIAESENLTLPERFLVRVRYGRGTTNHSTCGPWIHNGDWTAGNHWGTGVVVGGANRFFPMRAEGSASGGPPYVPTVPSHSPFVLPDAEGSFTNPALDLQSTIYPATGMTFEYEIKVPVRAFPGSPRPMINWVNLGGPKVGGMDAQGARADRGLLYAGSTGSHMTTPVTGWQGQRLDKFGFCFRHPIVSAAPSFGNGEVMINDIVIMTHWMDW